MAEARQQSEWLRAAVMAARVANSVRLGGKPVHPLDLIPPEFRPQPEPPPEQTPAEEAEQKRDAWEKFDAVFGIRTESWQD